MDPIDLAAQSSIQKARSPLNFFDVKHIDFSVVIFCSIDLRNGGTPLKMSFWCATNHHTELYSLEGKWLSERFLL